MDSDSVLSEESEYIIGFQIWLSNIELSLIWREKSDQFFAKKRKNMQNLLIVFGEDLYENMSESQ